MPFDRGSFTVAFFELTDDVPENILELFATKKAGALDSITAEVETAWVSGRHLLDTKISGDTVLQGGAYYLALRQAVRKIPASLLNALCKREEEAYLLAHPGLEFVSSKVRRELKEEVVDKYIQKMPPSLSGIPMVLEPHSKLLYVGATSQTQLDLFIDQFYQVTRIEPLQLTPALILEREFQTTPASFPRVNFCGLPNEGDPQIGRDFLTFLWYFGETTGKLQHPEYGEFDLMIEAPLVFADDSEARGAGEASLKKGDSPLRSAEAKAALEVGKKLKKAKITLTRENQIWSGTFDADQFTFSSFKLPEGEEMNPDEIFADRVRDLETFRAAWIAYFHKFAEFMFNTVNTKPEDILRNWVKSRDAI